MQPWGKKNPNLITITRNCSTQSYTIGYLILLGSYSTPSPAVDAAGDGM